MPWVFSDHETDIAKNLEVQHGARTGTAYGNEYVYDQTAPQEPSQFIGELIDDTEWATLLAAIRVPIDQPGNLVTITAQGVDWQGNIIRLKGKRVAGTVYRRVELTLKKAELVP